MRHNRLKDLAANPNFVSGIYNYCDRWCERCSFTSRCLLYATEQEDPDASDPEVRDITNAKFWRKMHEIFADTAAMISECAAEAGVDLNSVDVSKELAAHQRAIELARRDKISRDATDYATVVQRWFDEEFIKEDQVHTDVTVADSDNFVVAAADAAEVIRFYQFFIAVKLMRALSGAIGVPEENFDDDEFLSFDFVSSDDEDDEELDYDEVITRSSVIDANGSTKTALIAIDRSLAAWRSLQISLPEKSETIRPMMIRLDALRRSIEERFPKARDFIRPGLDELLSDFAN
jgi:hypothetical protein